MKPIVIRALAASSAAIMASLSPLAALADEPPGCDEQQPPIAAPPPEGARSIIPKVIVGVPPRDVATFEETSPNSALIGSGALMFGLAYGGSVIVGAASDNKADQHLLIPVAGPWMNIANRSCPENGNCPNETANKVLLAADGIFQAAGVLQILGGFLFPQKTTVTRSVSTGVRVSPRVGPGSLGISASGAF